MSAVGIDPRLTGTQRYSVHAERPGILREMDRSNRSRMAGEREMLRRSVGPSLNTIANAHRPGFVGVPHENALIVSVDVPVETAVERIAACLAPNGTID